MSLDQLQNYTHTVAGQLQKQMGADLANENRWPQFQLQSHTPSNFFTTTLTISITTKSDPITNNFPFNFLLTKHNSDSHFLLIYN